MVSSFNASVLKDLSLICLFKPQFQTAMHSGKTDNRHFFCPRELLNRNHASSLMKFIDNDITYASDRSNDRSNYVTAQFTVAKKIPACRFYHNALRVSSKNTWRKSKAKGLKF